MFGFLLGLILGAVIVAIVGLLVFRRRQAVKSVALAQTGTAPLDLRKAEPADTGHAALELWWETKPIMSIERLEARPVRSEPVSGTLSSLVSHLLDDERIHDLLMGDRYAMVKVPRHLSDTSWMRTLEGATMPVEWATVIMERARRAGASCPSGHPRERLRHCAPAIPPTCRGARWRRRAPSAVERGSRLR